MCPLSVAPFHKMGRSWGWRVRKYRTRHVLSLHKFSVISASWRFVLLLLLAGCVPDPAERNNTANTLSRQERYSDAIPAYQLAQVLAPDSPVPYYNAGIALAQTDDLNAAALALVQALKTDDDALIQQAYYNLGNVYFAAGQYFNAVEAFKRVLERNPDDANARYNYELALLYAVPPTPENQQQQNKPEDDQTDQNVTPTPQPNALTGPTETPPREDTSPDLSETPIGGSGDFFDDSPSTLVPQQAGRMSLEDAERLLDALEQDLEALSEYLNEGIPSGDPVENDW